MFEMGGGCFFSVENSKSLESMRNIVGSVFIYVGLTERHYRTISSIVPHTIQLNLPLLTALLSVRELKRCTVEIRKTQSQKRRPKSGVYLIYAAGSHLRFLYLVRKTQLIPLNPFSTNPQMGHRACYCRGRPCFVSFTVTERDARKPPEEASATQRRSLHL